MGAPHSKPPKKPNNTTLPPPYTTSSTTSPLSEKGIPPSSPTTTTTTKRPYPLIQATDIPQWKWTNTQCQEWLTSALIEYCGNSSEIASQKALEFLRGGFAPMLYAASYRVWESYLGSQDAPAIYSYLMTVRKAAVPVGVYLCNHDIPTKWERDGEGRR